jgi:hypothetical protein
MPRTRTLVGRINGTTGAYLGNRGRQRDTNATGNRITNHTGNYRNIRSAFGMATG